MPRKHHRRWGRRANLEAQVAPVGRVEGLGTIYEPESFGARVEVPLDDGELWWVAALFTKKDDRDVIVELRVFPGERCDEELEIGEWSSAAITDLPSSGITARLLRGVSFGDLEQSLHEAFHEAQKHPVLRAIARDIEAQSYRPGRKGRSGLHYARWAARYVDALRRGAAPVADLAEESGLTTGQVRDVIRQARRRKLLTKTGQGKAGGELTPKALELLSTTKKRGSK